MTEREIFLAALNQPSAGERAAFLDQACGPDAQLRGHIEALLAEHEQLGSYLESPVAGGQRTADEPPIAERPGTAIGPYKLFQQLGEGGMGTVFLAEQTHPVQRQVALKVIKPGMDSRQVIARFEAERQALALMDHVNIARVFDGGATESGRPYFVMELVHGVPITRYCDDNQLTPRQRLELFVPVCQALQHAHQKGIIHRDVKPSNVMVTLYDGKPVPKVIDFGVAKATEQKLTERTLFTQYGTLVGTLEYMSPEQAEPSALGVDTRSDVYSLGVLLYELLTGSTPLQPRRLPEASYAELLRMIKEDEPPRPSTRLSDSGETLVTISAQRQMEPAKLTRLVRGELDWIVLKALEKDRNRRYETANDFAADVRRYLNDEPVQACPPTPGYWLMKFARRNKGKLAAATVLGLALLLTVGVIGWAVRDRSAREEEARRAQTARQARVAAQIQLILDEVAQLEREQKWPEALETARRASDLLTDTGVEAEVAWPVRDTIRVLELVRLLEDIRADRSEWKGAGFDYRGTAERYAAAFRDVGIDLARLTPEEAAHLLRSQSAVLAALIPALDDWAACRNGTGDKPEAKSVITVAALVDPDPWRQKVRQALRADDETALLTLAAAPDVARQPAATLALLGGSLRIMGRADAAIDVLSRARRQHPSDFWVHYDMAHALGRKNPPSLEQAAGCYRTALGLRPRNTAAWNNLGGVLLKQGQPDEARDCYHKALDLDPKFAPAHYNLGVFLSEQKKLDGAIACFRKTIEFNPTFATAHSNLGVALAAQNQLGDAIASFRRAIALDPDNATAHQNLGTVLAKQGKLDDASASYQKASELDPENAKTHYNFGNVLHRQGKADDAVASYRKAIEFDPKLATAHYNLGVILAAQNKLSDAAASYEKALDLDPNNAHAHRNLGNALLKQGKLDAAIASFRRAIALDPNDTNVHQNLGAAFAQQNKVADAIASYRRATALDPNNSSAHQNLGTVLAMQGKLEDAVASYRRAIALDPKNANAHHNLGNALRDQKKPDDAIVCYRQAIALNPKYAMPHHCLGNALTLQGKLGEAIACQKRAIELNPKLAIAHTQLARCLSNGADLKLRNPQQALQAAERAAELAPRSESAWLVIGWANYRVGQWEASIAALEKSMALQTGPKGGDANQWFFLAMAHRQTNGKDEARRWYDQAVAWMNKHAPENEELRRIRAEAEAVLQIKKD